MTTRTDTEQQVEGAGDELAASLGAYPVDELLIRNESQAIEQVLGRMDQGLYVMNPDFQRDFIWDRDRQSKLIESVLARIPLPAFYFAEDGGGRRAVVDGLQRLSTLQRFARNELRLRLPGSADLNRRRLKDLDPRLQDRFGGCNLTLYVVDSKTPERIRLEIFERVNSGVPLTRQQMRNSLYMGEATGFLKDESSTDLFLQATGGSLSTDKMRDREFVNRFCAFQLLELEDYSDMDGFLGACLEKMNAEPDLLPATSQQLRTALGNNLHVFGRHAFRKHAPNQPHRGAINASLWDVMSTGLSRYPLRFVEERAAAIKEAFHRLARDDEFAHSISYATNDVPQVKMRFARASAMFEEVLGAPPG